MAQRQAQPMGLLASTHPGSLASSEAGPQRGSGSPQEELRWVTPPLPGHQGGQGQLEVIVPFNRWSRRGP